MNKAMDEATDESAQPWAGQKRKASAVGCAMWTPIAFPARESTPEVSATGDQPPVVVAPSADDSGAA